MGIGWMAIGLIAAQTGGAVAPEPCVVPPMLKGFATPLSPPAGAKVTPALPIGRAVRVPLAKDAALPVKPDRAPAAGTFAGAFGFTVKTPGRYRVVVDGPVWIDVASSDRVMGSVAHGHAPACSGARKMVDFELSAGFHVVQLSGATTAAATVLVAAL